MINAFIDYAVEKGLKNKYWIILSKGLSALLMLDNYTVIGNTVRRRIEWLTYNTRKEMFGDVCYAYLFLTSRMITDLYRIIRTNGNNLSKAN